MSHLTEIASLFTRDVSSASLSEASPSGVTSVSPLIDIVLDRLASQ